MEPLRPVVLERLIQYYRYLFGLTDQRSVETITSAQLGTALDIDPTQVRKDFGAIGLVGISHRRASVEEIGWYDPQPDPPQVKIDTERIDYWVGTEGDSAPIPFILW